VYGASVGAVRGTVRDSSRKFPGLAHDEITALSSELWSEPVFERRLAAVVLLQSNLNLLITTDLTRLEGFLRSAANHERLVLPLIDEVIVPFILRLDADERARANMVIARWTSAEEHVLVRAARAVLAATG
jgi:hypothetical protein